MSDNDCPQIEADTVYKGDTGEAAILVQEVWKPGTGYAQVGFAIADDDGKTITTEITPERAREIAAGLTEAADRAMWRGELAGEA